MRGRVLITVLLTLLLCAAAFAAEARTYTVQPGDTPGEIAGKFAPSLSELREANPRVNFDVLQPGAKIVDPRPEPAELKRLEGEVATLKDQLAQMTELHNTRTHELAVSQGLKGVLDARVAELEPLAVQAEAYRDRFWSWVSGLAAAFIVALIGIARQMRARGQLDRKIIGLQKDVARARLDGTMDVAAPRSPEASRPARANGADTGAHHPH